MDEEKKYYSCGHIIESKIYDLIFPEVREWLINNKDFLCYDCFIKNKHEQRVNEFIEA